MSAASDIRAALVEGAQKWLSGPYREGRKAGGPDRSAWREMAEFGWLGVAVPEEAGGLGLSFADLAALAEAVGAANVGEPLLAVAGVTAPLLAAAAHESPTARALLDGVLSGDQVASLAHAEPGLGFARAGIRTSACPARGWRLNGTKCAVEGGDRVCTFLVSAQVHDGTNLFVVARDAPGLTVMPFRGLDGRSLADLRLDAVEVGEAARLSLRDADVAIDAALDRGAVLAMADAVGAMGVLLDATLAHLKTRRQFGQPIGQFQALQHRAVDMFTAHEEARAVVEAAAAAIAIDDPDARQAIATAKVVGARAARLISREAVQMHGGMGLTEDLVVSHLFRRLVVAESLYGDADFYLDRYRSPAETTR